MKTDSTHEILFPALLSRFQENDKQHLTSLIKTFIFLIQEKKIHWDANLVNSIENAISRIDQMLSLQLSSIMHDSNFQAMESSWRGVSYLVCNTNTSPLIKIKLLPVTKDELSIDFKSASDFDQSSLFKLIYESEFGTPGGEPYAALVGDFQFSEKNSDVDLLKKISAISALAFCPFITTPSPELFGITDWSQLNKLRDLSRIFDADSYIPWNQFRQSQHSKFVVMTLPRVMSRLPYDNESNPCSSFYFNEFIRESSFAWMSSAYVFATRLTRAFDYSGWCTAIRGAENGGKINNLPFYATQCPTEIMITDRREAELSRLGFLPLCHYKRSDYAVFFGAQTCHQSAVYDDDKATANARIAARIPYIMATSRFAHYLKVLARDKLGSFMEVTDVESWLNKWILNYANANANANSQLKVKYPLMDAKVKVSQVNGTPGVYHAVAYLRPWLQMEELTASLRLVAEIPKLN